MNVITVTVSYNNFKSTKEFIDSYMSLDDLDKNLLVVVDNSNEEDQQLKSYISKFENAKYIRQEENKGYMAGCNFGYNSIKNSFCDDHIVIYTNNDILFSISDFFSRVIKKFNENPKLGIISPYALDSNSKVNLNPFLINRPSKYTLLKLRLLYSNYFLARLVNSLRTTKPKNDNVVNKNIYATHGCMFIMKSSIVKESPDDKYFLYGEEITIAEIARNNKVYIEYFDDIKIEHVSHATTGKRFSQRECLFKRKALKHIYNMYKWES